MGVSLASLGAKGFSRRMSKILIPALILALAAPAAAQTDLLAPARAGKLQCYTPDAADRSCRALIAYSFAAGGKVVSRSETVLSPDDPILMKRRAELTLRGGALCGRVQAGDLDQATFTIAGRAASPSETAILRARAKSEYAEIFGKEICTSFKPARGGLEAGMTLDGVPQPDVTDQVVWVDAKDGWVVGPRRIRALT